MAAQKNAAGGKDPWFGHAAGAGKREGMAERPNHPDRRASIDKVQRLRERLGAAAKQHPGRRFHALFDRISRDDVLLEAWKRVKRNRGSAGVDSQTLAEIEQHGIDLFLEEIAAELREGEYRPKPVLRRYIPKSDGKTHWRRCASEHREAAATTCWTRTSATTSGASITTS